MLLVQWVHLYRSLLTSEYSDCLSLTVVFSFGALDKYRAKIDFFWFKISPICVLPHPNSLARLLTLVHVFPLVFPPLAFLITYIFFSRVRWTLIFFQFRLPIVLSWIHVRIVTPMWPLNWSGISTRNNAWGMLKCPLTLNRVTVLQRTFTMQQSVYAIRELSQSVTVEVSITRSVC